MTSINLDAYYTDNPKVQRSEKYVLNPSANLPKPYSFNDKEASKKLQGYSQDVYVKSKKEECKPFINFMKYFCIGAGAVLLVKIGRKIFKKS